MKTNNKSTLVLLLFAACMVMGGCSSSEEAHGTTGDPDEIPFPTGFLNVGHGGAKDLCPANTLECFQIALNNWSNALEVDLQVLGDGTLVTYHDGNTLGQTGEDHDLADLTIDEMKALDAGWDFSPDGDVTHPFRGKGIRVPTFEEFLTAFPGVPVLLDVKVKTPEMAAALFPFVSETFDKNARRFVYIKTHDIELTDRLRSLVPPVQVAFNTFDRILMIICPALVESLPVTWVDLNPEYVFSHVVKWTEQKGHILTVSTLDEEEEMREFLAIEEVDGIVTNRPDLLDGLLHP